MVLTAALPLIFVSMIYSSTAFHSGRSPNPALRCPNAGPLSSTTEETSIDLATEESSLDPGIASQFTIKVCTSTSCTRKLKERGLDQYHVLGELYAQAQSANMEKCVIVEDGGCQGGRNCKMGPCVAIQHEEFMGNVGLEGMNSNEFQESVWVYPRLQWICMYQLHCNIDMPMLSISILIENHDPLLVFMM